MRLGYSRSKNSIFYYAQKTVYVDGKNKSMIVKKFGSEKYICETYGVTDAKSWAQEQVALMNLAEKEENAPVSIDFSLPKVWNTIPRGVSMADISSFRIFTMNWGLTGSARLLPKSMALNTT